MFMKKSGLSLLTAVSAALWVVPMQSAAEEAIEEAIEEIIVTANPLGRATDDLTQPALILGEEELLKKAANSIGETLANELGMSTTYFGPVAGRPIIRGQDGPRVAVLDGGLSTMDAADISPDHAVPIEPLFAERIEVLRGPATLLYGSSAAGGVVNVIDSRIPERKQEEPLSGAMELRGDSASEELAAAARLDGSAGALAWHVDGFKRDSGNIEIPGFATADPVERPDDEVKGRVINSDGDAEGYAGGLSWIGEQGFVGASVSRYETTYGLPGPEEGEEEEGDPVVPLIAAGPFIELEQTRVDLHGAVEFASVRESLRFKVAHNDYQHQEIEPSGEVATTFENDAWEGRVELVHAPVAGLRGSFGLQMSDREFSAVGAEAFVPTTATQSYGVFMLEEFAFESGLIDFGFRVETTEHKPDGGLPKYDETALSAAIGLNWDFADEYDFTANLSRSERNLGLEELYANGAHLATGLFEIGLLANEGDSADQEVASNLDLAIHHHGETVDWRVGVFYNDVADYVFRVATDVEEDGLPLAPYLQADAEFYGIEAELMLALAGPDAGWNLRLFTDYVRGKTDGQDLPRIQPLRLGAELGYANDSWSAGIEAVYHAEQNDINSFKTKGFTILNANVTLHLNDQGPLVWDVFMRGTNLLDEDARRSTSFRAAFVPLPGASLHAGIRARFN
jgi:iron complex outermembrane recepter protein